MNLRRLKSAIAPAAAALTVLLGAPALAATPYPWSDPSLAPDARADLVQREMTLDEKLTLVYGYYGIPQSEKNFTPPPEAVGSAGYVPGVPRLGVPALQETDAGVGVAWAHGVRKNNEATSLPAGIATAATWNPQLAMEGGAMIGREARNSGFNVLLAGGVNLARDPRNGRNFEYAGEDPLLAGVMVGAQIRGIESNRIISTIKHYALNDQETGRMVVSSNISDANARESDLLAFQLAIEAADPGSVMCAYNRVNGDYACENDYLLNQVLKRDWKYPGFVMSDWGAVHSTVKSALAGLDQESAGQSFDDKLYFQQMLKDAVVSGQVPQARLDDMVHRILRTMFAKGLFDSPPVIQALDVAADSAVSQADAEQAIVLLKNDAGLLPLAANARRIAVIGGHADVGVLSGGGSSQVMSHGGNAVPDANLSFPRPTVYHPSSPMKAIQALAPSAQVRFASGADPAEAARLAADSDVVIVFATQWLAESFDAANLSLPDNQDALISAVARANRRTVVVLETGNPVTMPWLQDVGAVLEAWYPGSKGGEAIARVLFGQVNPSGRLPVTFPASEDQLVRPKVAGAGLPDRTPFDVNYDAEGTAVGYKWFQQKRLQPLFAFGHGLSYTRFGYTNLQVQRTAAGVTANFDITNVGSRPGMETGQVYVQLPASAGEAFWRLAGWNKVELKPGEVRHVSVPVDPRLLAKWDGGGWRVPAGQYRVFVGRSSADQALQASVDLGEQRLAVR